MTLYLKHLILEEEILVALQGCLDYFCRFYGSGSSPGYYFIGMSLVGKSIQQLKQSCTHQIFSLWTSLMVAKQMMGAIRYMHKIGYLHRYLFYLFVFILVICIYY